MNITMRSYLRSYLRSSLKTLFYLVAFSIAVTFIFSSTNQCYEFQYLDYGTSEWVTNRYYSSELGIPVTILAISCYVLPVLEFAFFKKRRNLDCAYALPISRREMGIVHYLTGFMLLVVPFSCSYFVNFLLLLRYPGVFNCSLLPEHYCLCLLFGVCIYSVFVFIFNQANSTGDGIWFVVLWTFVIYLVSEAFDLQYRYMDELGAYYYNDYSYMGIPFMTFNELTVSYMEIVDGENQRLIPQIWSESNALIYIVLWLVLGVASAIGFYLSFGKQPAQKTEEISDSWFGYRVMIPVYGICGMILFDDPGAWVLIEGIAFVGYMIYRKGFHLKKSDWIVLCMLIFFLFV